jgi:hypothetical protein
MTRLAISGDAVTVAASPSILTIASPGPPGAAGASLLPHYTMAQRPAASQFGRLAFVTNTAPGIYFDTGTTWILLDPAIRFSWYNPDPTGNNVSTTALQQFINDCITAAYPGIIDAGTYLIDAPIFVNGNFNISGAGMNETTVRAKTGSNALGVFVCGSTLGTTYSNCRLANMTVDGNGNLNTGVGQAGIGILLLSGVVRTKIENVMMQFCFGSYTFNGNTYGGIGFANENNNFGLRMTNCDSRFNNCGIKLIKQVQHFNINDCYFYNNHNLNSNFDPTYGFNCVIGDGTSVIANGKMQGCLFETDNPAFAPVIDVQTTAISSLTFVNAYAESHGTGSMFLNVVSNVNTSSIRLDGHYWAGGDASYWCNLPDDHTPLSLKAMNINISAPLSAVITNITDTANCINKTIELDAGPFNLPLTGFGLPSGQTGAVTNLKIATTGAPMMTLVRGDSNECICFIANTGSTPPLSNAINVRDRNLNSSQAHLDIVGAWHTPAGALLGGLSEFTVASAGNPLIRRKQFPGGTQTGDTEQAVDKNGNGFTMQDANFHFCPSFALTNVTASLGSGAGGAGSSYSLGGILTATVRAGGTGYAVNDTVTIGGGTLDGGAVRCVITVDAVSSGAITTCHVSTVGGYTVYPANPGGQLSTSGSGTGASFNLMPLCNDNAGTVTITTGSGPSASAAIITLTFGNAYLANSARAIPCNPVNAAAAGLAFGAFPYWTKTTTTLTLNANGSALGAGTYQFSYVVWG